MAPGLNCRTPRLNCGGPLSRDPRNLDRAPYILDRAHTKPRVLYGGPYKTGGGLYGAGSY